MFEKGVAIVYVTEKAARTAFKVRDALKKSKINCSVFAPKKYASKGTIAIRAVFKDFIREIFNKVDAIVAVMATGIIIRAVAPFLKSKLSDPAVVSVDVAGRFVVSLISGHFGGANYLTKLIADEIGAIAVITTASDALGKKSVEELARSLHCKIENPENLAQINSLIVNEGKIALIFVGKAGKLPKFFGYEVKAVKQPDQAMEILKGFDGGIIVAKERMPAENFSKPFVFLKPKTVAIGVGARKDVSKEEVLMAVKLALKRAKVPLMAVEKVATVEVKRSSSGIIGAAKELGLKLQFISVESLRYFTHEDLSPDSKIVKEKIGVGGVCERAALIAAGGKARLILKKMKVKRVTVAIAEGE